MGRWEEREPNLSRDQERRGQEIRQEEAELQHAGLLPQLGICHFPVLDRMRLGVEMVDMLVLAVGPFSAIGHAGEDQPLEACRLASRVEDVLPVLQLVLVGPLVLRLARLRRLL